MANHHTDSCHFIMNLRQYLSYMGVYSEVGFKKKQYYMNKCSYDKNWSYVRLLVDVGFIPFNASDEDNFINVVDGNYTTFSPDIINCVESVTTDLSRNDPRRSWISKISPMNLPMYRCHHLWSYMTPLPKYDALKISSMTRTMINTIVALT